MPSNSLATNVDEASYLHPQPSDEYIRSHQSNFTSLSSSPSPTTGTTTVAKPASSGYYNATSASTQRHPAQDDPNYQSLQLQNGISSAQLYQPLRTMRM